MEELKADGLATLADDEPPWMPEDSLPLIAHYAIQQRQAKAKAYIDVLTTQISHIDDMTVTDANTLHEKMLHPPPYLALTHRKVLNTYQKTVEQHLSKLEVEWLVARYEKMDGKTQRVFLKHIGATIGKQK